MLVNICQGPAATLCRQNSLHEALDWKHGDSQISTSPNPLPHDQSVTSPSLRKLQFDENKFKDTFTSWEFEVARYEKENSTLIPDNIKIVIVLNETKGALDYSNTYIRLRAGQVNTHIRSSDLSFWSTTVHQPHLHACKSSSNTMQPLHHKVQHQWARTQRKEYRKQRKKKREAIRQRKGKQSDIWERIRLRFPVPTQQRQRKVWQQSISTTSRKRLRIQQLEQRILTERLWQTRTTGQSQRTTTVQCTVLQEVWQPRTHLTRLQNTQQQEKQFQILQQRAILGHRPLASATANTMVSTYLWTSSLTFPATTIYLHKQHRVRSQSVLD